MGAHVGTYINAPTLGVAGLLVGDGNTAMACNGWTSGMTFACPPLSVWSVGLWAKAASPAGAYDRMFGTVGDRFDIAHDDTGNAIKHYTAGTGWVNTSTLAAGETAMFVYTFDGTNLTLYKNGLSVYTVVAGTTLLANTASFGTMPAGTDGTTCTIDEPALWNRALTPAEDAGLHAVGAGTVYWESLGSPSIANTFPYETLTLPDDTVSLANAIFIGGTGIYGFVEDSESIAVYGRHEDGVRDTSVKDMLRFSAVGNAMLDQNKYPVQAATLTHRKPGLRAGMVVNLTDHVWGLVSTDHGIDFLISKIITTPDPSGIIEQELQFSPAWGPWSGS
jgi:hypothetical protein